MNTAVPYLRATTRAASPETDPGPILGSSAGLGWRGVHVERGRNAGFVADDVVVPRHYFAMITDRVLPWETRLERGFRRIVSKPDEVWVNPANVPFTNRVAQGSEFVLLTLDPEVVSSALPEAPPGTPRQDFNARDTRLQALILALLREAERGGPNGRLFVDTLAVGLSAHFVDHYGAGGRPAAVRGALDARRFGRALDFLEANLGGDPSLDALAEAVALSKFHLVRRFRDTVGLTPHQYLLRRRLDQARERLLTTDRPLGEIALSFGFADQSHFQRHFRAAFGVTPGTLRRR